MSAGWEGFVPWVLVVSPSLSGWVSHLPIKNVIYHVFYLGMILLQEE